MFTKSEALLQITRANTNREVLGFTSSEVISIASINSQYRKLAILVHPDKNEAENASQCFLKLKDAFEWLVAAVDIDGKTGAGRDDKGNKSKKRKAHQGTNTATSAEKFKAFSELFTEEEINGHTENWKRFHSGASLAEAPAGTRNTPVSEATPATSNPGEEAKDACNSQNRDFVCLLCKRRFKSAEQQAKHELTSALHKANLVELNT